MKLHTTNYFNTLIEPAEDCPAISSQVPPQRGGPKSVANYQFEMLQAKPYHYTSDDLIFEIHAMRKEIPKALYREERSRFFSKGQPCLRTSPLAKRYGWGIHSDADGKLGLLSTESPGYTSLLEDPSVIKTKAMKSAR